MCQYKSGIIDIDKNVYVDNSTDSHERLKVIFDLDSNDKDLVRWEIVPKDELRITKDRKDWQFIVDEWYVPRWLSPTHIEKCWETWEEAIKEEIYINENVKTVKDRRVWYMENATVSEVKGKSEIVRMAGHSIIEKLLGKTNVYHMYNYSMIKEARDKTRIWTMHNYSTVFKLCDEAKIKAMFDDSRVCIARDRSRIRTMYNDSVVDFLMGDSVIENLLGHSMVRHIVERGTVKCKNDTSVVVL